MKKLICLISLTVCVLLSSCYFDYQTVSDPEIPDYAAIINTAKAFINSGKYEDAYKALYSICEYPEAKEMLADFTVVPQKTLGNGASYLKPKSYVCKNTYDKNGVLIGKEEELPNDVTKTYTYTYDEMGRVLKEAVKKVSPSASTDSGTKTENNSTEYTYNEYGDITVKVINESIGFPYRLVYDYTYDENGKAVSVYDEVEDTTTYFTYNEQGQLVKEYSGYGSEHIYEYDQNGNLIKESIGENWSIEYTYNSEDKLIKKVENYNDTERVHSYEYNEYGVLSVYTLKDENLAVYVEKHQNFLYFYTPSK